MVNVLTQALFEFDGMSIGSSEVVDALKEIGIHNGDIILVHSDISVFGKLVTSDRNILLESLVKAFRESVGENGTIVMPTFTYSFCKGEVFNTVNTKSTVGALTEYFRTGLDVSRTSHPIFSMAIWGKQRDALLKIGKDSFGRDSIFGHLHQMHAKIVFFGISLQAFTFIHYIEQTYGIPYRTLKTFRGRIRDGETEYEDECTFFVRDLDKDIELDFPKIERHLSEHSLLKGVRLGNGRILMADAYALYKEGHKLLDQDIYFFLKDRPL